MQVIFLAGYPGSGKGTQGKILSAIMGLNHISTGELFRNESKSGSDIGNKFKSYMDKGEIIPNDIHFEYLSTELKKYPAGYILDGYPKNLDCLDFIVSEIGDSCKPVVVYLNISRQTAFERLSNRLFCEKCETSFPKTKALCDNCFGWLVVRHDDSEDVINKRLDVFEASTEPLFDRYAQMGILNIINGERSQQQVLIDVLIKLFPQVTSADMSSVFHNHIDANCESTVHRICEEIQRRLHGPGAKTSDIKNQTKFYGIDRLLLCDQVNQMSDMYSKMPNFHTIKEYHHLECFSTCKMGSTLDYDQMLATLKTVFSPHYQTRGVMTEVEEELICYTLSEGSGPNFSLIRQCEGELDYTLLENYRSRDIVKDLLFELHHGFDLEKNGDDEMPIDLKTLSKTLSDAGFSNGGWFIFTDDRKWKYRSNEFSGEPYVACLLRLVKQSAVIIEYFNVGQVTSSLEKVHAIWPVDSVIFVNSSNRHKLDEYYMYLNDRRVIYSTIEIQEPDADSITIIRYKASQLPIGYLVDDVSLDIEGEDVGTKIKSFLGKLSGHIGKRAIFHCYIGVRISENTINIYKGSVPGVITNPVGSGFGFGPYFLPDGAECTLGESYSEDSDENYNARYVAIYNFKHNHVHQTTGLLSVWEGKFQ